MEKPVEIEVQGHKAKIMSIQGEHADGVFYKEDMFIVRIDCDEPFGRTVSFFVELPVESYGSQEFIQAVREAAEKKVQEIMTRDVMAEEKREAVKKRQADLDSFALQLETLIQERRLM